MGYAGWVKNVDSSRFERTLRLDKKKNVELRKGKSRLNKTNVEVEKRMPMLNKRSIEFEKRRLYVKTTNKSNFDRKKAPYLTEMFQFVLHPKLRYY